MAYPHRYPHVQLATHFAALSGLGLPVANGCGQRPTGPLGQIRVAQRSEQQAA